MVGFLQYQLDHLTIQPSLIRDNPRTLGLVDWIIIWLRLGIKSQNLCQEFKIKEIHSLCTMIPDEIHEEDPKIDHGINRISLNLKRNLIQDPYKIIKIIIIKHK